MSDAHGAYAGIENAPTEMWHGEGRERWTGVWGEEGWFGAG